MRKLTTKTPTNINLRKQLKTKKLPIILNTYNTKYILTSIQKYPTILHINSNNTINNFLKTKIKQKINFKNIKKLINKNNTKKIYKLTKQNKQ